MQIYNYINLIIITSFFIQYIKLGEKKNKKKLIFLLGILFIVSAIRNENVGTDLKNYLYRFEVITKSSWKDLVILSDYWRFELGFTYFCKILSEITEKAVIFTLVTSFIFIFGFYKYIYEFSIFPVASVLIFFNFGYWGNSMNIVRQSMAISILAFSCIYLSKKEKIKYIILIIMASLLHVTSLIFILLYPLNFIKFKRKILISVLCFAIIMIFLPKDFINILIRGTSFGWYINSKGSGETTLIILTIILLSTYFFRKKIVIFDKNIDLWLWMLSLAIFFNSIALKIGIFERVMKVFLICLLIIVADLIYLFKLKRKGILGIVIVLCFTSYFYFILMKTPISSGGIIPYKIIKEL